MICEPKSLISDPRIVIRQDVVILRAHRSMAVPARTARPLGKGTRHSPQATLLILRIKSDDPLIRNAYKNCSFRIRSSSE